MSERKDEEYMSEPQIFNRVNEFAEPQKTEPNNLEWLEHIIGTCNCPDNDSTCWFERTYNELDKTDSTNLMSEKKVAAITAKISEMQTEAYKKGYIQCDLDELRKYENDKS